MLCGVCTFVDALRRTTSCCSNPDHPDSLGGKSRQANWRNWRKLEKPTTEKCKANMLASCRQRWDSWGSLAGGSHKGRGNALELGLIRSVSGCDVPLCNTLAAIAGEGSSVAHDRSGYGGEPRRKEPRFAPALERRLPPTTALKCCQLPATPRRTGQNTGTRRTGQAVHGYSRWACLFCTARSAMTSSIDARLKTARAFRLILKGSLAVPAASFGKSDRKSTGLSDVVGEGALIGGKILGNFPLVATPAQANYAYTTYNSALVAPTRSTFSRRPHWSGCLSKSPRMCEESRLACHADSRTGGRQAIGTGKEKEKKGP